MLSIEGQEQGRKTLIMVVDDNPQFLSGVELTLEMEGYKVWTAPGGQEALDALKSAFLEKTQRDDLHVSVYNRLPDLILADIMMPVMDGYEFYEHVRANPYLNHIPFIFLTAKASNEDIRYGKGLGADDYLPKLSGSEDLLASVQGKLKRVEQQRVLATHFTGDISKPSVSGLISSIVIISIVAILACAIGIMFALNFLVQ